MVCQISCVWFVSHLGPPCTRPLAQAYAGTGSYHLSEIWASNPSIFSHLLKKTNKQIIPAQTTSEVTTEETKPDVHELAWLDPSTLCSLVGLREEI